MYVWEDFDDSNILKRREESMEAVFSLLLLRKLTIHSIFVTFILGFNESLVINTDLPGTLFYSAFFAVLPPSYKTS